MNQEIAETADAEDAAKFKYVEGAAPAPPPKNHTLTGMLIVPKGTKLLVDVVERDERVSPGGIVLPQIAEEDALEEATVVAVGQGRYNQMTGEFAGSNYEVGDRVWFKRVAEHLYTEIPGQKNLLLIQEDLCVAVLVEQEGDRPDEEETVA